jgi:hypothetical protein
MLGTSGKTFLAFALGMLLLRVPVAAALDLDVTATVAGCGDGSVQISEECDGFNYAGESCSTQGFSGGSLSCDFGCSIVTSACTNITSSGGPSPLTVSPSTVIFSGKAYPESPVSILQDGQLIKTTTADPAGNFQTQINNVTSGNYIFSLYTEDSLEAYEEENRSALSSISINVGNGGTYIADNIFLSPILDIEGPEDTGNSTILIYGRSAPGAEITVTLNTIVPITILVTSGLDGYFVHNIPADLIPAGIYSATAVAELNNASSTQSLPIDFGHIITTYMKGDFNENARVNLVDFSMALYWYKESLTEAFKVLEVRHGNGDGLMNLVDISIIAYYWTG